MKTILVAMPTYTGQIPMSVVSRMLMLEVPEGCEFKHCFIERTLIWKARDGIATVAMNKGVDYLFFWDDDQIPDRDILVKMVALDKDIVGCPIPSRRGEKWLAVHDEKGGKLVSVRGIGQVGGIGMANTLIKTSVLKRMYKEWKQLFYFLVEENDEGVVTEYSEDLTFCKKARELGFEVWCDATIKSIHIGYPMGYYYDGDYKSKLLL